MKLNNITLSIVNEEKQELMVELISGVLTSEYKLKLDDEEIRLAKKAVEDFHWTRELLVNREFPTINDFDQFLYTIDATSTKRSIGVNVFLVLSTGFFKILAKEKGLSDKEFLGYLSQNKEKKTLKLFFSLKDSLGEIRELFFLKDYFLIVKSNINIKEYKKKLIQKTSEAVKAADDEGDMQYLSRGIVILESVAQEMGIEDFEFGLDFGNRSDAKDLLNNLKDRPIVFFDNVEQLNIDKGVWVARSFSEENIFEQVKRFADNHINSIVIDPSRIGALSEIVQISLLAKNKELKVIGRFDKDQEFLEEMAEGLGLDGEMLV